MVLLIYIVLDQCCESSVHLQLQTVNRLRSGHCLQNSVTNHPFGLQRQDSLKRNHDDHVTSRDVTAVVQFWTLPVTQHYAVSR